MMAESTRDETQFGFITNYVQKVMSQSMAAVKASFIEAAEIRKSAWPFSEGVCEKVHVTIKMPLPPG